MRLQFLILNAFKARKQTVRNIHSSIVSKLKVQKGSNSVRSGLKPGSKLLEIFIRVL